MPSSFIERPRYLCSLGGAMGTVTALPATIPILHAAAGCAGNITWTQNGGSGLQVGGYCGGLSVPSSNVREREVVFGGEDRLREEITNTLQVMDGDLYIVITGCVTEIIGDDVRAVVNDFRSEGVNIVAAETGGFRGNSYYGYDLVLQALIRDFVRRDVPTVANQVNLWGIPPYLDPFWRGNLEGVRGLLQLLGLEVNSFFTQDDSLAGINEASGAALNIVVSDIFGAEAAQVFKEVHGTPYLLTPLPIGPTASDTFLRAVGQALGRSEVELDALIANENHRYYQYFEPLVECFTDLDLQRYAAVVGDANYGVALTRFLADDLGWLPEFVAITDQLSEEQETTLQVRFEGFTSGLSPHLVFETDSSEVIRHFNAYWTPSHGERYYHAFSPAFVIGSSLDRDFATSLGAGHLSVSFPVTNRAVIDRGYTGYRGGLRLVEDLISAIVANR